MTTALFTHPACFLHDTGPGHPERPGRLRAVLDALSTPDFAALQRHEAPLATAAQIERVHAPGYCQAILDMMPKQGRARPNLNTDTVFSPKSGARCGPPER